MSRSGHIHHGYRLRPGLDLMWLADRLRSVMEPICHLLEVRSVARFAAGILDQADLAGLPRPASVIFDALQAHTEQVALIQGGVLEGPLSTLSLSITDDPQTGERYALFFSVHPDLVRALDDLEIADYYPYWDEADHPRPVGVSAAEWERRGQTWERVLRGSDPHSPMGMFTIEITDPMESMDLVTDAESVAAEIPSNIDRAHTAVQTLAENHSAETPQEMMAFMASLPARVQQLQEDLKPITVTDLAGSIA